jgi:hypothetical protein
VSDVSYALSADQMAAHHAGKKTTAALRTAVLEFVERTNLRHHLDDVDFSWEIARNFETNFLLAHGRLCPNLHSFLQCF